MIVICGSLLLIQKGAYNVRRVKEVHFINSNAPCNLRAFCEAVAAQILEGAEVKTCATRQKKLKKGAIV